MPVKAANALDEKIDGGKVRDEEVSIDIDRLLNDLGGYEKGASGALAGIFAEKVHPFFFVLLAFPLGEAGVDEAEVLFRDLVGEAAFNFPEGLLGESNGVADDDDVCPGKDFLGEGFKKVGGIGRGCFEVNGRRRGTGYQSIADVLGFERASGYLGDEGIGLGLSGFGCSGCGDELGTTFCGEGGRENNDRGADLEEILDKAVDEG